MRAWEAWCLLFFLGVQDQNDGRAMAGAALYKSYISIF